MGVTMGHGAGASSAPRGDHRVGARCPVVATGGLESELSSRGARGMGVCGLGLTLHASGITPVVPGYIDSGSGLEFATWPLEC
ncbi:hypothetical protein CK203_006398 [Vitis vinifera]|uniref:Uncharacterized protein n=1 Tax=Vitis vinifera TaxID=29760 RepID=A0A438KAP9_VITVI|nr:hypothetical protein CK203_006398 [Vitis vinifera]